MCLCVDTTLQGVSYVEQLPDWQLVDGLTYMAPLPQVDFLEAVYMQMHDKHKPRIHFSSYLDSLPFASKLQKDTSAKTVPLPPDGILSIPC